MEVNIEDGNKMNLEQFKMKRLIKKLTEARGNGTSMISIIVPPKKALTEINRLLTEEFSTASSIKDRVNRQSVQQAMTSAKEKLKQYGIKTPPNGLVLYCGNILEKDKKTEKKLTIAFEPFRPINTSLYFCGSVFKTEDLKQLLDTEAPFGFIVVDGNGAMYATLQGNSKDILHKFTVELPKKHRRGGQSSVRFARIRVEKRHNYLRKVCDEAVRVFISNDRPTVSGLILAGSADFKNDLNNSDMFDPRLQKIVVKILDVSYGGQNGLTQAIEMSQECIQGIKYAHEKKMVSKFFEEISTDTGKYVFGLKETMYAAEMGAIDQLLVFENLEYLRVTLKNKETQKMSHIYLKQSELNDAIHYKDPDTSFFLILILEAELEPVEEETDDLTDWLAENYHTFCNDIHLISDKSAEGTQFVKGFSGIGGILRYKIDIPFHDDIDVNEENFEDDDFI